MDVDDDDDDDDEAGFWNFVFCRPSFILPRGEIRGFSGAYLHLLQFLKSLVSLKHSLKIYMVDVDDSNDYDDHDDDDDH